ncbi:ADYC domain-containing protein [Pyxidicoccus sp. MSG2]|uniref:ADYC domain-containing protein n=1 Tax=Pyxidicoccus sp. MSG2 TaxID=2996790 RepID=UPI002271519C|nr:ADYC domain-containing protein [Pyxidicoccus sp. MSG2]MCY1017153.1 ADYC domain-containing protein [Pyxidicoccus sp. MSG2]
MRRFIRPALGAWAVIMGGLSASMARADPPPQSDQGTRLHGTGAVEDAHVNIRLEPTTPPPGCQSVTLEKGGFKAQACVPTDFAGATFTSVDGDWTFKVNSVHTHESIYQDCTPPSVWLQDTTWEYDVTVSRGSRSSKLCPDGSGALAVPLMWAPGVPPEAWTVRPPTPVENTFTFACVPRPVAQGSCEFTGGGVIAKCIDWGYPPWEHMGQSLTGQFLVGDTVAMKQLSGNKTEAQSFHQACLRMATADYCGVGQSNTLDGTPIAFYDTKYVPLGAPNSPAPGDAPIVTTLAEPDNDLAFEAAWADCRLLERPVANSACDTIEKLRLGFGAVCLSKKRWSSLPVAGTCFDPKAFQGASKPDMAGKPCEDYTEAELEAHGARFFSFSRFLDTGLYRFTKVNAPAASITTTKYDVPSAFPSPGTVSLKAGIDPGQPYHFTRFEGAILSRKLSPALQTRFNLRGLYRCVSQTQSGLHYLLNTTSTAFPEDACAPLPHGRLDTLHVNAPEEALEGFVSQLSMGFSDTELLLWRDVNGNFITATVQPGSSWTNAGSLGFIPGNN